MTTSVPYFLYNVMTCQTEKQMNFTDLKLKRKPVNLRSGSSSFTMYFTVFIINEDALLIFS